MPVNRIRQLEKIQSFTVWAAYWRKSISFFLLPIYTRIFTPSDYGTIEMLAVLASFLGAFMILGLDSAPIDVLFQSERRGRECSRDSRIIYFTAEVIMGCVNSGSATFWAPYLNYWFFGGKLSWEYFALAFGGTLLGKQQVKA